MLGFHDADLAGRVVDADDDAPFLVGFCRSDGGARQLIDGGCLAGLQTSDDDSACLDVQPALLQGWQLADVNVGRVVL